VAAGFPSFSACGCIVPTGGVTFVASGNTSGVAGSVAFVPVTAGVEVAEPAAGRGRVSRLCDLQIYQEPLRIPASLYYEQSEQNFL
jgi:hypothetical protein